MTTTVTVEENNISLNLSDGASLSSAAATMAENLASSSGATLPGPLSFSGTTHRGIRLINLTTAQRDAVATPGAGALIWNTTTSTVQEYGGSAWADVGGGDLLAANNLSELTATASTARTNIGAAALGANTFTGEQNLADQLLTRPVIKDYGETVNPLGNVTGTMTIDLENGNYVTATLTGAVTVLAINNWPTTGTLGSLTLELTPAGNTVVWTGVTWVGTEPTLGSTVDFVVLWSHTAGATIYAAAPGATA